MDSLEQNLVPKIWWATRKLHVDVHEEQESAGTINAISSETWV